MKHGTKHSYYFGCRCPVCLAHPWGEETKAERLERIAREMREHNLNHGKGCRSIARAIAERMGAHA